MRLKDGYQTCLKCDGDGCYWCRKSGWMAQCPVCMNSEPELISKDENEFDCLACESRFDKAGKLVIKDKPKPKPKPAPAPKIVKKL